MYYVIERTYVGPNPQDNPDATCVEISQKPARTNSSREIRTEGWCGTTNDISVYAHGEYETLEEAHQAISEKFGATREVDDPLYDEDIVDVYMVGEYEPMTPSALADWLHYDLTHTITADTTDEELEEMAESAEKELNAEYQATGGDEILEILTERRDELVEAR